MGFSEKLAGNAFKTTPEGDTVFYPNGALGKGRRIPDEATRQKLFRLQVRLYKLTIPAFFPYLWLLVLTDGLTMLSVAPTVLFAVYFAGKQYRLLKNLPLHTTRLGFGESVQKSAQSFPDWYYRIFGVFSGSMIVAALLLPVLYDQPFFDLFVVGIASLGVVGLALALAIRMHKLKHRAHDTPDTSGQQTPHG